MCNRISNHRLGLTRDGRIQCDKCWKMWDLAGAEILPFGNLSEKVSLGAGDVARVLVENLINRNHLRNAAEIHALRDEAAESPELFIEEILGCNQP